MQTSIDQLSVLARLASPTPAFFKKLRLIGVLLASVSATLLTAPVALPLLVTKMAGYLAVAGTVLTAVSQTAVQTPAELSAAEKGGDND